MSIAEEKARLRKEMRAKNRALKPEYRAAADRAIRANVLSSPYYAAAETVFAYLGVGWEIETRPLLEQILADGKRLCLPLCTGPHEMSLRLVSSLSELAPGAYGIPEPPAEAPALRPEEAELALVPCVAADRQGRRLGQGGGYYDAFLSRFHGAALLLCREAAVLPEIPVEKHDFHLHFLVTETKIYSIR
ncbi:MAG: 5-formyltetrahydrofolate cyclo-ligase [Oscillospiraceae bacterium]